MRKVPSLCGEMEMLSEILNINPPLYSKYRNDIFTQSYNIQEDGRCSYIYGSRFQEANSILNIYKLLKRNPTSKGAVIQIFQHYDLGEHIIDKPCTTQYQFSLREGKLDMFISMRSWDMGPNGGFKYDFGLSCFILQLLSSWLNVEVGKIFFYVKSLHIYEKDIKAMRALSERDDTAGQVFNIGGVGEISILQLAEKIKSLAESTSEIKKIEYSEAYEKDVTKKNFDCNILYSR